MAKKKVTKRIMVPRTRNAETLTESQYFSKIRSALRSCFRYWKPMAIALENSSRKSQSLNKKLKKEYQCAHCSEWFKREDVEIDHVIPAGSLKTYDDIAPFIIRLTTEKISDYQILCKTKCHRIKTNDEKQLNKTK